MLFVFKPQYLEQKLTWLYAEVHFAYLVVHLNSVITSNLINGCLIVSVTTTDGALIPIISTLLLLFLTNVFLFVKM